MNPCLLQKERKKGVDEDCQKWGKTHKDNKHQFSSIKDQLTFPSSWIDDAIQIMIWAYTMIYDLGTPSSSS